MVIESRPIAGQEGGGCVQSNSSTITMEVMETFFKWAYFACDIFFFLMIFNLPRYNCENHSDVTSGYETAKQKLPVADVDQEMEGDKDMDEK